MGAVLGELRLREHEGRLQLSRDGGTVYVPVIDPGTIYTVSGNQTDFDITPLVGESDGAYSITGRILANGANPAYTLQPNAVATNQKGSWFVAGVGNTFDTLIRIGDLVTANENALDIIDGFFMVKSGRIRTFRLGCLASLGGGAAIRTIDSKYIWLDTTTALTSLRIHSSVASGIGDTSYFKLQKLYAAA